MEYLCVVARCPRCGKIYKNSIETKQTNSDEYPKGWAKQCTECNARFRFSEGFFYQKVLPKKNFNKMIQEMDAAKASLDNTRYHQERTQIEKWVSNQKVKIDKDVSAVNPAVIIADNARLKEYLKGVLKIETYILSLEDHYVKTTLQKETLQDRQKSEKNQAKRKVEDAYYELECNYNKHYEALKKQDEKIEMIQHGDIKVPEKLYADAGLVEPVEPREPVYRTVKQAPPEPIEPIYATPGFFNKKKVLEENERLRQEYCKEQKKYKQTLESIEEAILENEKRKNEYNESVIKWKRDVEQYKESREALRSKYIEEESAKLSEGLVDRFKKRDSCKEKVDKYKAALDAFDLDKEIQYAQDHTPAVIAVPLLKDELDLIKEELKKAAAVRKTLYSVGVIYPDYQNISAVSSFYDYISSRRCYELEGPDGAYNLYETEKKANTIIGQINSLGEKMDLLLDKLDEISLNQGILYRELIDANKSLTRLGKKMDKAIEAIGYSEWSITDIIERSSNEQIKENNKNMKKINTSLSDIKETSEYIAYNTERTAYYSKKGAEMTDALGLLIALK